MGRDSGRNILDDASDYVSADGYYTDPRMNGGYEVGDTLKPGDMMQSENFYSPDGSNFDTQFYKQRGRSMPTEKDRNTRANSPGAHPPMCVCELCNCGAHACPAHGTSKKVRPRGRFEGQSSYFRDYVPPPSEALAAAFPAQAKEQSGPPQPTMDRKPTGARPKFEGSSSYHRDYVPPPREALNTPMDGPVTPAKQQLPRTRPPFEGLSSNKRDFVPPPSEAYTRAPQQKETTVPSGSRRKGAPFEGESMMRRDYQAPPKEVYSRSQPPPRKDGPNPKGTRPPFEGEAMSRREYRPPPPEAYIKQNNKQSALTETRDKTSKSRPPFEGETSQKRDFVSPPKEAYNTGQSPAKSTLDRQPSRTKSRFEADSSMRRDFVPPPREAYKQSEMPSGEGPAKKNRSNTRFQGESMSRSHYVAPPREAYDSSFPKQEEGAKRTNLEKPRDGRNFDTTFAKSFGAPPVQVGCRSAMLMAENQPPTPGSGREHVYWDPVGKKWL